MKLDTQLLNPCVTIQRSKYFQISECIYINIALNSELVKKS